MYPRRYISARWQRHMKHCCLSGGGNGISCIMHASSLQNDFSPHHRRHRGEKSAPVRAQLALCITPSSDVVASRCSPCSFCRENSGDYGCHGIASCVRLHPCIPLHSGLTATATSVPCRQVPDERGLAINMWAGCTSVGQNHDTTIVDRSAFQEGWGPEAETMVLPSRKEARRVEKTSGRGSRPVAARNLMVMEDR